MEHKIYQISEAEQLTGEKAHVLRYWEEELGITIGRNAMGHRFYTAEDIQIFLSIKELKKKGLHLKAIRELLPKLRQAAEQAAQEKDFRDVLEVEVLPARSKLPADCQELQEAKTVEVREVGSPVGEFKETPERKEKQNEQKKAGDRQEKEKAPAKEEKSREERQEQFYQILERLMRQMMLKKRQEERYKRVDEAIRKHQRSRKEAAVTAEQLPKKKRKKRK